MADLHLPSVTGAFAGGAGGVGAVAASLPRMRGAFAGHTPADDVLLTVVVGLHDPFPVSTYEQFPFNSFAQIGGQLVGASSEGLFLIDAGETDNGAPVSARIRWGQIHFGTTQAKRIDGVYVSARSDGDLTVRVIADEAAESVETLEVRDVETIRKRRVKPGKGLRGSYMELELENIDGAMFDIDSVLLAAAALPRRV